jgi:mono/diheme cytochrome c family protein
MTDRQKSHPTLLTLPRAGWMISLLVIFVLLIAACQPGGTGEGAAATEAPAVEAATEEATAEATTEEEAATEPAEEATAAPEEGTATATPEEETTSESTAEGTATAEPEEEATAAPEEEGTATAEPEEEATAAPEEEGTATAEPAEEASTTGEPMEHGQYLFTIARGCGCHFNGDLEALAGGNSFNTPNGEVYSANITPHEETGIGSWTAEEIATAIHTGARPDGTQLSPVMPYRDYSILAQEDALAIANYLLSQEPVENAVPARELTTEPEPFTPDPPPAEAPTDPVERGEYLVVLARCSGCHTPRNEDGSPNMDMWLAGNRISEDEVAWNITPDEETGIGTLGEEEIAHFMRTGELADGSQIVGTMATQIERYFSHLTEEDAAAIAAYLKSIPPVNNDPEAE